MTNSITETLNEMEASLTNEERKVLEMLDNSEEVESEEEEYEEE